MNHKSEVLVKKKGNQNIVFSKIQTPTQDLVPETNLKICYKFEIFDTTTQNVHDFGIDLVFIRLKKNVLRQYKYG